MPTTARIPALKLKALKTRAWDVPMVAYTGAKLGVLVTLAHHLHHAIHDVALEETFLNHRLVELVGFPCAGLVLAGSVAALRNWLTERR
jgi:hypothetical protein